MSRTTCTFVSCYDRSTSSSSSSSIRTTPTDYHRIEESLHFRHHVDFRRRRRRQRRQSSSSSPRSFAMAASPVIFTVNNPHDSMTGHAANIMSMVVPPFWVTDSAIHTPPVTTTTTFEPVLNLPALITFVFITVVFSALIIRTNQVEDAVRERNQRLQELRDYKTQELQGGVSVGSVGMNDENDDDDDGDKDKTTTTTTTTKSSTELARLLQRYQEAVQREEELRNVLPGTSVIRIVPPSASSNVQEEERARLDAQRFLGKDYDIGTTTTTQDVGRRDNDDGSGDESSFANDKSTEGLPPVAIGILVVIVLSQLGILAFFSSLEAATKTAGIQEGWF